MKSSKKQDALTVFSTLIVLIGIYICIYLFFRGNEFIPTCVDLEKKIGLHFQVHTWHLQEPF